MHDFECPYCDEKMDWSGDPLPEGADEEVQCSSCEKNFTISVSYSVNYRSEKADCLNDDNHDWKDSCRTPWIIAKRVGQYCTGCGRKRDRDATAEEITKELERLKPYPGLEHIALGT